MGAARKRLLNYVPSRAKEVLLLFGAMVGVVCGGWGGICDVCDVGGGADGGAG